MNLSGLCLNPCMSTPPSPVVEFAPHFSSAQVQAANTSVMNALHRLRFEVYCRERAFLPEADYPDQMESDSHDASAAHFAAFNGDQEMVGCVRLVEADGRLQLPFQSRCTALLHGLQMPPPEQSAEVSRLIVRKDYRRRRGDVLAGVAAAVDTATDATERRSPTPQIMLSLYRSMYAYSLDTGLRYWFAAMEGPLARVLAQMGFAFKQIGSASNYFGVVMPYLADLRELEVRVGALNPDLFRWLRLRPPLTR